MRSAKFVFFYWSIFAVPIGLKAISKPLFESPATNTGFVCLTLGITILLGIVLILSRKIKKDAEG